MPPIEPLTEQEINDGGRMTATAKHMTPLGRIAAFLHYHVVLWRTPKVDTINAALDYLSTLPERGTVRIRRAGKWYGDYGIIERIDE